MADETNFDISGVTFDMSGIEAALLPKLISMLSTDATLRAAIVQAIMPDIHTQMATIARRTAGAGTTTPRNGRSHEQSLGPLLGEGLFRVWRSTPYLFCCLPIVICVQITRSGESFEASERFPLARQVFFCVHGR